MAVGVNDAIARLSKGCDRKSWRVPDLQGGAEVKVQSQRSVAAYAVL